MGRWMKIRDLSTDILPLRGVKDKSGIQSFTPTEYHFYLLVFIFYLLRWVFIYFISNRLHRPQICIDRFQIAIGHSLEYAEWHNRIM